MENILGILGLLLGGGGAGFYFNYLINNRKADHDEFRILLETWKDENKALKEREKVNSDRIYHLTAEIMRLKSRLILLSIQAGVPVADLLADIEGETVKKDTTDES